MEFIQVEGTSELSTALVLALNAALAKNEPVLWLVPGGSNIKTAVEVMARLEQTNLNKLTIALTDERFGPVGHADSNFFQLHQMGLQERGATFTDLLSGLTFAETVAAGSKAMEALFSNASTVIGYFGMGADGHIAGILPHTPAAVDKEVWMIGYDGGQFQRFTLTPFALSHVQQAYLGAFGPEKLGPLTTLHDKMLPIAEQPVQILRHIPEASIFNDQLGD
jgi:6-phosphogluconolactonase/glucosamine-6-phosphate isomerase/deaminase